MKKNLLSDNNRKCSKGFYAALGISAVMIGSACYFSYGQSKRLTRELAVKNSTSQAETPVAKHQTGVPRSTTTYRITTNAVTTVKTAPLTTVFRPVSTLPAASITIETAPAQEAHADIPDEPAEAASAVKLDHPQPPLSDISNIIAPFSCGELVKNTTTGSWQTHNGTDIAAEAGSEVYAVSSGEVTAVDNDPLWGVTVTIDHHNGYISRYCGLSTGLSVQKGDTLVSGDVIGTVGNTADIESALPPHLHIEMLHNGAYIDTLCTLNGE